MDAETGPEPEPVPAAPEAPGWGIAAKLALGASGLLVLLVILRALCLEGEFYDAYEYRVVARRLLAGTYPTYKGALVFRSPLVIVLFAGFEGLGTTVGWIGPALVSAFSYTAIVACVVAMGRQLGLRPWTAALGGLLVATDQLTFMYSAHGLADIPCAAACALTLWLALSKRTDPAWRHTILVGLALGLVALLRPNAGVLGLAFVAGFRKPWTLPRLAGCAAAAAGTYIIVASVYFSLAMGGVGAGFDEHLRILKFASDRSTAIQDYAGHGPVLPYLRTVLASSPLLAIGAMLGAVAAFWKRGVGGARVVLAWAVLHLLFCELFVGHLTARLLFPATPALAVLAAVGADALADRVAKRSEGDALRARLPVALVAGAFVLALAWSGPYEWQRNMDPAIRASFNQRVAARAQDLGGPEARYMWTTTHPYPVVAEVVHNGTAYTGDPFYGIQHMGWITVGYHLREPVVPLVVTSSSGDVIPGLTQPAELRDLVRGARFPDGTPFREGDVLLVGITVPTRSWDIRGQTIPPFKVGKVVSTPDGLDVVLSPLTVGEAP